MSETTGTEPINDPTWIEVQFAGQPHDAGALTVVAPQPSGQQASEAAMERLLIDAQRESGQSSLAQSGSASPALAGSGGSRSPIIPAGGAAAGGTTAGSDWQRDWPTRFVAPTLRQQPQQQHSRRRLQLWRFLSLRKAGLLMPGGGCNGGGGGSSSLLLGLLTHAASFLLGAASMYIIYRCVGFGSDKRILVR